MAGEYTQLVRNSLLITNPREAVDRVKDVVTRLLAESDPAARINRTSFFNHSYSPDFVLEWPKTRKQEPRAIYLRSTQSADFLSQDIDLVADPAAMFIQLDELYQDDARAERYTALDTHAREARTLVAEIGTLENLNVTRSRGSGSSLFTTSVVRGGIGLIEEDRASAIADVVATGFSGAGNADRASTAAAVETIDATLDLQESRRLKSVLQAVWVSSGESAVTFPSPELDLSDKLSPDALAFLLNDADASDTALWERLARAVDLDVLGGLGATDNVPALQVLMKYAVSRLRARVCVAREGQERLDASDAGFRWSIERGQVCLRGHGRKVWLANKLADISAPEAEARALPRVEAVRSRARQTEIVVTEFQATNNAATMSLISDSGRDVFDEANTSSVDDALGESSGVRRVSVILGNSIHFDVGFNTLSGASRSRGRPPLGQVVWTTLGLLFDLNGAERDDLREAVLPVDEDESSEGDVDDQVRPPDTETDD